MKNEDSVIKDFRNLWRERPSEAKGILFTMGMILVMGFVLLTSILRVFGI
jgi:hypothetical protein